jgi:hypothetical protein
VERSPPVSGNFDKKSEAGGTAPYGRIPESGYLPQIVDFYEIAIAWQE